MFSVFLIVVSPKALTSGHCARRYSEGTILLTIRATLLLMRSIVKAASVWSSTAQSCLVLHTEWTKGPVTVTLVEDFVLLGLMLSGLQRYGERGTSGLWRLLYHQVRQ
jgi:hypothetical protein